MRHGILAALLVTVALLAFGEAHTAAHGPRLDMRLVGELVATDDPRLRRAARLIDQPLPSDYCGAGVHSRHCQGGAACTGSMHAATKAKKTNLLTAPSRPRRGA